MDGVYVANPPGAGATIAMDGVPALFYYRPSTVLYVANPPGAGVANVFNSVVSQEPRCRKNSSGRGHDLSVGRHLNHPYQLIGF